MIEKKTAYRLLTRRLCLRCWAPEDAPAVQRVVGDSLDSLRPWMPWVQAEPLELSARVEMLRRFRSLFDRGEDFLFAICSRDDGDLVGGLGLHPRVGAGGLEIGYWVRAGATGRGIATEAAAAATRLGLTLLSADRIEIRVEPKNAGSVRIPEKLGFAHEATLRRRLPFGNTFRDQMIWTLFAHELAASPAAEYSVEAFDALAAPISL
jgi:RimJ/RimL family protein N-acetyltransferase